MARRKRTTPRPTRDTGQISLDLPNHFNRLLPSIVPTWAHNRWYDAEIWRAVVDRQPVAIVCREALISNYLALDWKIEARDSEQRDELKESIKYHTKFIENTGEYDYAEQIEWIGKDVLDLSFGAAAEIGKERDEPTGRVVWMELLDGGTLFPTHNKNWPVGQVLKEAIEKPVYFPKHRIDRIYMSPITNIHQKGWGLAPPQKIFLAINLLNRGDVYYANLLLDTPEAGILDLMDMEEQEAKNWLRDWREDLTGVDGFKVPVLYQHDLPAKFIPFGKPPTDLMYDRITLRYASLITAGYGITLSDIGVSSSSSGGDTLSGTIRQERQTKRTGFAKFKRKIIQFYNFILPDTLEYKVVDLDDEQSVAKGRSLLSQATGWNQLVESGMFSPQEARQQMIADGLITISVPEKIPPDAVPRNGDGDERPGSLGRPIPASEGGHGEVIPRSDVFSQEVGRILKIENIRLRRLIKSVIEPLSIEASSVMETFKNVNEAYAWNDWADEALWGKVSEEIPEISRIAISNSRASIEKSMQGDKWWELCIDPEDVTNDFVELLADRVNQKLLSDAKKQYENGNIDLLPTLVEQPTELRQAFGEEISTLLNNTKEKFPSIIVNCIISGARKALSIENAGLDTDGIIQDNITVSSVRREMNKSIDNLIIDFATNISNIINNLVENVK